VIFKELSMSYIERSDEEIITVWEQWLEKAKSPDQKTIRFEECTMSLREFVQEMRAGNSECLSLGVDCLRRIAQVMDHDPLQDITRQ
jgi:protein-arginine kinase activator protein McsA